MYIMCVCLFSALSHRVDTLQISIIIVIIICHIQSSHALKPHLYKQYHNKLFQIMASYLPPAPPPSPATLPSPSHCVPSV